MHTAPGTRPRDQISFPQGQGVTTSPGGHQPGWPDQAPVAVDWHDRDAQGLSEFQGAHPGAVGEGPGILEGQRHVDPSLPGHTGFRRPAVSVWREVPADQRFGRALGEL
jgi:hypothetical protein